MAGLVGGQKWHGQGRRWPQPGWPWVAQPMGGEVVVMIWMEMMIEMVVVELKREMIKLKMGKEGGGVRD